MQATPAEAAITPHRDAFTHAHAHSTPLIPPAPAHLPPLSCRHYNRGISRDRWGDYAGAVEDFSAALRLDPGNADFYHNRGFSLRKQVLVLMGFLIIST